MSFCRALRRTSASSFFFNDTATTEIYTLSLHDALPILSLSESGGRLSNRGMPSPAMIGNVVRCSSSTRSRSSSSFQRIRPNRSEEHTSELQSRQYLVCRLLLEKKEIAS